MRILAATLLGIVQGLTEFLPISSSAHLLLVPWIFGWNPEGLTFDVSVHVGTSIAVLAYFWRDWALLAREMLRGISERDLYGNFERRLGWFLVIGTLPAAAAGLLLEDYVESHLRSPFIPVITLVVFAILLYYADRKSRQNRSIDQLTWRDSLWVGTSQAVALVPGVSRSGITISTAMLRNVNRPAAARFSFLLSTPVIVGAGALEGWHFLERTLIAPYPGAAPPGMHSEMEWSVIAAGIVSAALTGFFCIRYFLRYLQTNNFVPFVIYRIVLAAIVLVLYLRI